MITRKTKKLVYNIVVIALLVIGMAYVCSRFIHLGNVEYTDNAQVKQHITPVNTRVQGFIKKIYFDEYKPIHKGDTLLVIEDAEFRLRLAQAEADLANALAGQQVTSAGIATMPALRKSVCNGLTQNVNYNVIKNYWKKMPSPVSNTTISRRHTMPSMRSMSGYFA